MKKQTGNETKSFGFKFQSLELPITYFISLLEIKLPKSYCNCRNFMSTGLDFLKQI